MTKLNPIKPCQLHKWCYLAQCLGVLVFGFTWAQSLESTPLPPDAQVLSNTTEIVEALGTASQELMVATATLRSKDIANALREAMVDRGVAVYILVPEEHLSDPASFIYSVALAGASVRLSAIDVSFITLDRQTVIAGTMVEGVTELAGYESKAQTLLIPDAEHTMSYVEGFYTSFEAAPNLDLTPLTQRGEQP